MENSRSTYNHGVQFVLHALLRDVLKGPVPVIIIVLAEVLGAAGHLLPCTFTKRHTHVMLATYPWRHLHLQTNIKFE